ncbi:MAG TPA: glycosyltransferase [Anaerolineae bacterium]|nr:glycosyltransferase [Anaerolineae bacterium]
MGGPVNAMAAYTGLLAEAGYPVTVYSVRKPTDGGSFRLDPRVGRVEEGVEAWNGFRRSAALWRREQAAEINLVHSHGLWADVNRLADHAARQRSVPHLLAPCGMLAPGALRHHGWKKVLSRFWFQDRALRAAQCLHAKSRQEYEHIRSFGLRNPVAIIPNPIAPPPVGGPLVRGPQSVVPNRRTVLFLGRMHRVKGLARLVRAWAEVQRSAVSGRWSSGPSSASWQLVLAGPDEGGYRREVEALIEELGCQNSVMLIGELDEKQKWNALAAADLFVMPSDFENFGNAIVEAMLCAVPVVATTGTPWEELKRMQAGWWVEPRVETLADALREALTMPDAQRQAMGQRAFKLADQFRPSRIGADLVQVYQWLLSGAVRPACVRCD